MLWRVLNIAAHLRIRLLLVVVVAVICGGVFSVTELQRRSDAAAFSDYEAAGAVRDAAVRMTVAFSEASARGAEAAPEVTRAQRRLVLSVARLESGLASPDVTSGTVLVRRQSDAASALVDLAMRAVLPGAPLGPLERSRDIEFERLIAANDTLLAELRRERSAARRSAARRPVALILALFLAFGGLLVVLVERPALLERRRRSARAEFTEAMQVARSEEEAYGVLARHVERVATAERVVILNRNNSADRLEPVTPLDEGSPFAAGLEGAAPGSCLAVRLAATHHRIPGADALLACDVCGRSPEQTTCVPTVVGGEVIGSVLVEHQAPLADVSRNVIAASVREAAPVVANLRNLAVAELRAATDGLTGLANQRQVHETLKRAAAHAGHSHEPMALVLFDLDHFKAVNDTYGHGKGDEVLAAVGAVSAGSVRAGDFVGRFGGEEFAIVLAATDRAGAVRTAEKVRAAIASISVPGVDRRVTASFGVALLPDDAAELEHLLRVADRALYAAKNGGRNRVSGREELASVIPSAVA